MSWHPIETAPRDGKDFLCIWSVDPENPHWATYGIGYWLGKSKSPTARDSVGDYFDPTHWMPLPAPPNE